MLPLFDFMLVLLYLFLQFSLEFKVQVVLPSYVGVILFLLFL